MSTPLVSARRLQREYGQQRVVVALDDVSLDVFPGESVSIVGPSGSGKSTLLGILGLLDRPTAGELEIDGVSVANASDPERARLRSTRLGFVFQQFHLVQYLSAVENVEASLLYRGVSKAEKRRSAFEALEAVGLQHRATHRPVELSGGEQQRVAIARALAHRPQLLLADEPTGNLDSVNSAQVLQLLLDLVDEQRALVLVTHDATVAQSATRTLRMQDGRIVSGVPA